MKNLKAGKTVLKSVGGEEITFTKTGDSIQVASSAGTANLVKVDLPASNGLINVLDSTI
jgi:uncharacterized surface protein with fasciclin (FAS1) repeats